MRNTWTKEMEDQLRNLYPINPTKDVAVMMGLSLAAVTSRAKKLKIRKDPEFNKMIHMEQVWTAEQDEYLVKNYDHNTAKEIGKAIGRSKSAVKNRCRVLRLTKDENKGRFRKGRVSQYKGKKQHEFLSPEAIERTKATRFKRGIKPHNTRKDFDISERFDVNTGRTTIYIRIALGTWKQLHRWMWEQLHGKIPKGMVIAFKDGNTGNCTPDNLEMISREEIMKRNSLAQYPPDVRLAITARATLKRTINKMINQKERK